MFESAKYMSIVFKFPNCDVKPKCLGTISLKLLGGKLAPKLCAEKELLNFSETALNSSIPSIHSTYLFRQNIAAMTYLFVVGEEYGRPHWEEFTEQGAVTLL